MRAHSSSAVFRRRGLKMVGVVSRPAGPEDKRFPAVLLLHGFPGSEKNTDIQRELMHRGAAGLCLHFAGAWGSDGLYRVSTLVSQARAGLRWLAGRPFVDPRRLAVLGSSMGGWVAIHLAARVPSLKGAVAVAPAGGPEMITPDVGELIEKLARPLRAGSLAALKRDAIGSFRKHDPAKSAARMKPPLLIFHGTSDELVPHPVSERIHAAARSCELRKVRGADHGFLDRRAWLSRQASDWLVRRLKRT